MDVTPRELRDIDIREGFRGYNRDDVDELLERAAATIEGLNERMRRLAEQATANEGQQGQARETEDMLHRTLLLAQRAADEAVAEAQFKARQILDDAESKSRAQLAEAESQARRQIDTERRRIETEVIELGSRREALLADVDGLERFEAEYRQRLRRALENDLESLAGAGPAAPSARPTIHEVDVPATGMVPSAADTGAAPSPAPSMPSSPPVPPTPPQTPKPPSTDAGGPPTAEIRTLGSWDVPARGTDTPPPVSNGPSESTPPPAGSPIAGASAPSPAPAPPSDAPPSDAPPSREATRAPLFPPDAADAEPLDDEAFFASLREAVSDQAPLGPRDELPDSTGSYEDDDEKSGLFRRRR
ncbi:MAG TPA: DivIVA domain-containing protein [Acidimicrobiia bacterium]|jgi:DivIVA domain-containing protein